MLLGVGVVVTLTPLIVGTLFAHRVLRMNPVIICGALAGAMTVDAAVTGACEVAESQTPVLGVAVPYAIANVVLTVLGPIIVGADVRRLSEPIGSRNVVERTSIVPGQKEAEMRWVHLSVIILFAAVTIIFAVQNFQVVTVSFLRFSVQTPLALLVVVIYLLGTLTGGSLLALLRQSIERARLTAAAS